MERLPIPWMMPLRIAHDLYYSGGAEVGYDYHADDKGIFDGAIYKLLGE